MAKIRVTLGIGFAGATHEDILNIDENEWKWCATDQERKDLISEYWQDWSNKYIDGGANLIEED